MLAVCLCFLDTAFAAQIKGESRFQNRWPLAVEIWRCIRCGAQRRPPALSFLLQGSAASRRLSGTANAFILQSEERTAESQLPLWQEGVEDKWCIAPNVKMPPPAPGHFKESHSQ